MTLASTGTASVDDALAHATRLLAADPALAAAQAEAVLQAVPGHPVARLVLASSHLGLGDAPAALGLLEPLAREQAQAPAVHLALGQALALAGRSADAVAALRHALALQPALPTGWLALAGQLDAQGDRAGADAAYAAHVRQSTRDPDLMRAAAALHGQRLPEAEHLLRTRLAAHPTDVAALRMLGELAARLGRQEDAESLLERCLALHPGFHAARQHYAMVLHRGNRPAEALEEVERLLARDPRNPAHRNLKAVILSRIGDYAPALALYADLLHDYPGQARIWLSYGHALKTAGSTADAVAAYRRAIALEPGFGDAWWSLANLKTVRFDADDIAAMRAQLGRRDLDDEHRLHLDFALGKALEDAGVHADAFAHYAGGNALRRRRVPYSAADTSARLSRARALYTREFFARRAGSGAQAPDPIFIVGLPRAGSTLVEQILASHPLVEGTTELPEIISIARMLRQRGAADADAPYHEVLATLDAGELRALGEQYLVRTRLHRRTDRPFFIDKMPNNFAHIGLIQLALPNATIIDARRHPMACGFSVFKQHFARGQDFSYDLDDIGRYYRDYATLMAHFDAVLPGRIHRVHYEAMVADTEAQVRRLLAHCGLPFDDRCLRFFETRRPVRTASSEQVRRPIYREGLDQWRHFAPWLAPLEAALGPLLDEYPAVPD